jgi:hypothetical protein
MNQAASFALLGVGGMAVVKALTGASWADVVKGHPGPVASTGATLSSAGVAGVPATAASVAKGGSIGGYVNPLPGATKGRTDQGVDATLTPGAPILALGKSKVIGTIHDWYDGQPLVWLQLLDGSHAGQYWYAAEQITPTVQPGQIVAAGEPIGTYAPSGSGLELGWATATGRTLASATTGYTEGQATPAGQNFTDFLDRLGL